jgi:hypothetical protein
VNLAGGLALALASTLALNWGWVAQHGAAAAMPPLSLRRPLASLALLFRNLRWLAGFSAGLGGWVLYVAALALAPLSLVQAVSAGGIAVIAVLAWRRQDGSPPRSEVLAVAAGMTGLLLLAISLHGTAPSPSAGRWAPVALWLGISLGAAALAAGPGSRLLAGGAGLGAAAGLLYAAGDAGTKFALGGGSRYALAPAIPALHGLAFVCVQLAFQRGGALATAGTASLLTNAVPIAAGIVLFGERPPAGALGVVRVVAFACVVAAAALLARKDAEPAAGPRQVPECYVPSAAAPRGE